MHNLETPWRYNFPPFSSCFYFSKSSTTLIAPPGVFPWRYLLWALIIKQKRLTDQK